MSARSDRAKSAAAQRAALSKSVQGGRKGESTAKNKKYLDCHICGRTLIVDGLTARASCIPKNSHLGIADRVKEAMLS